MALDPIKQTTLPPTAPRPAAPAAPAPQAAQAAYALDSAQLTVPQAPDLTGLSAEEAKFVQEGFLPANFAALRKAQQEGGTEAAMALFRQGKKGPFEKRYGDPNTMLDGARRWAKNPELAKLVKEVKPGDILVTTWNNDQDVISNATKGPFIHALVCVKGGPPAEFVEALGVSGDVKDPTSNKVLHSMMSTQGYDGQTVRLVRPTAGLPPYEAQKAIDRAISYAENQLGKPYDFTFKNDNGKGMSDAFYCSELAWKAYVDPKGANIPIRLDKAAGRDGTVGALNQILEDLGTDDPNGLAYAVMQVAAKQPLDEKALIDLISNKVVPSLEATQSLAKSPEQREALKTMLTRLIKGGALSGLNGELARFSKDEAEGRYKGVLGFFRRVGASVRVGWAGLKDARELTKGVGFWRSLGATWKLAKAITPHAETLTGFLFGPNDPRTKQAKATLDTLDGMARDAHRIPLLGRLWPLPERPRPEINRDFVSPTDLAWADLEHQDFNVKPDFPIDKPEAVKVWK